MSDQAIAFTPTIAGPAADRYYYTLTHSAIMGLNCCFDLWSMPAFVACYLRKKFNQATACILITLPITSAISCFELSTFLFGVVDLTFDVLSSTYIRLLYAWLSQPNRLVLALNRTAVKELNAANSVLLYRRL